MPDRQELVIISEILEGQHEQYRFIVERYHRGLIQHLYNLAGDEQTAEDIAQEAFIRAYNKLSQYNQEFAFSTWLYKIADNLTYRHLKQARPMTDISEIEESVSDDRPSPHEYAEIAMDKATIRQAVRSLPAPYQRVISMYYWDNFSYEEIAVIMDHPVGTIRTWLFRAKAQLRKELYGQI
jgi:RNA polymerase sigma-70 factor (ECF subfamily)